MRYEIITDEGPESPRQNGFGTILYTSSRYELGDERVEAEEIEEKMKDTSVIAIPVYAMIHGSVQLNTTGFNCTWDSGQCGIIYVSKEEIRKTWNLTKISKKKREWVIEALKHEIEIYSQYLSGDVYGYRIFNDKDEEIESCWGFYGLETVKKEAQEALETRKWFLQKIEEAVQS